MKKTAHGALIEFDLRSCENCPTVELTIPGIKVRRSMHTSFLTGLATGLVYAKNMLEDRGIDSDCFDFEAFKADMNTLFMETIKEQSEIEV